jgi:alpha-L-rhamnosidase
MGNPWQTGPVKLLRHSFEISKPVTSARLYVTALGAYRFQINGARVGDQVLSPGWDDFRTHVPYQAYDVTQQLKTGQNAIGSVACAGLVHHSTDVVPPGIQLWRHSSGFESAASHRACGWLD